MADENTTLNSHDLDGVTKIPTPLFILFHILTLGIYGAVKWYRMTGDIRKIAPREETVSPLVITSWIILPFCANFILPDIKEIVAILSIIKNARLEEFMCEYVGISVITYALLLVVMILLYCHIQYHTLKNIRSIAKTKQNKYLKYNRFWAFLFGNIYTNFVFNTYDKRLVDIAE